MVNKSAIAVILLAGAALALGCRDEVHAPAKQAEVTRVVALRTEYRSNPIGIDAPSPRLSWQLESNARGVLQSAYQIRVALNGRALQAAQNLVWDSGRVVSGESNLRPYAGPPLESRRRYYWQLRVWDGKDTPSAWSAPGYWEMGQLSPADWRAQWIEPALKENIARANPAPMLRKTFRVHGAVRSARAYVTSHGLYEMYLNGRRVGDQLFTPGWTSYNKRLQYQTYDVTHLLSAGDNAVGVVLGDGWYRGIIGFYGRANQYGERLALLLQIHIVHDDGREEDVVTDSDWKAATGPIRLSQIYAGETYDARLEKPGWSTSGYDDREWPGVRVLPDSKDNLLASASVPVRRIGELKPVKIFKTPGGEIIADMGQNMVGWVRLEVTGAAGTTVSLRHAEVLDQAGNLFTENLGEARQEIRYTLKGGGSEVYEPHFTYQGFRYVAIAGYPGEVTPDQVTGIVIHSDLAPGGTFATSNPLVNRLQDNIVWSQKGNFFDVPTDCPQRNERLGWAGDAQVFFPTAAFNMNVAPFFSKWLGDLAADQYPDGAVPFVAPDVIHVFLGQPAGGAAGWGDAATVIPWNLYLFYGDKRILAVQYTSMARWVAYEQARAGDDYIWDGDFQFGDWMDFGADKRHSFGATDAALIATAYFAHSADLVANAAQALGKIEDASRYQLLHSTIVTAFRKRFVADDGRVAGGTQTAYVLALEFDLLPTEMRPLAAQRLAQLVRESGHLTTGFLGTPRLLSALSRNGHLAEAYRLLNRAEYPSWLYEVKQGATTIWERWDGIKPDGSFVSRTENSFNHFAYGAVGEWMYRVMAGIDVDSAAPGYRHVLIQPEPGGGFTHVKASHETPYGTVRVEWNLSGGKMTLDVGIPANTRATVRLPQARLADVSEGGSSLNQARGIASARQESHAVRVEMGSGQYRFAYATSED